jgi:hypothetical protein
MKLYILALLSLAFAATEADNSAILRRRLQDGASDAPTPAMVGGIETPQPTPVEFLGGPSMVSPFTDSPTSTASPTEESPTVVEGGEFDDTPVAAPSAGAEEAMAPVLGGDDATPSAGFGEEPTAPVAGVEETPSAGLDVETSAPVEFSSYTEAPVAVPTTGSYETEPTPTYTPPTGSYTPPTPTYSYATPAPSPKPQADYVATDDDPLQDEVNPDLITDDAWKWNDSTLEDVEHDRTVVIALSVTFIVGICLAILTAQQMIENPQGCCARYVVYVRRMNHRRIENDVFVLQCWLFFPVLIIFHSRMIYNRRLLIPQHLPYLCRLHVWDYPLCMLSLSCHVWVYG